MTAWLLVNLTLKERVIWHHSNISLYLCCISSLSFPFPFKDFKLFLSIDGAGMKGLLSRVLLSINVHLLFWKWISFFKNFSQIAEMMSEFEWYLVSSWCCIVLAMEATEVSYLKVYSLAGGRARDVESYQFDQKIR